MKLKIGAMVTWLIIQGLWQQQLIRQHDDAVARQLGKMTVSLIEKARGANDDLLVQQTVQSLAHVPGVSVAAVIDSEKKILAHGDPSRLGQRAQWRKQRGIWAFPMQDGPALWGTLLLRWSDPMFRKQVFFQMAFQIVGVGLAGFLFYWALRRVKQDSIIANQKADELSILLEDEKQKFFRKQKDFESVREQWMLGTQTVADRLSCSALFFDSQQRLVAWNEKACGSLPKDPLGKSWHEIPFLQNLGNALELSLAAPGQSTIVRLGHTDLELCSLQDAAQRPAGTWIFGVERLL